MQTNKVWIYTVVSRHNICMCMIICMFMITCACVCVWHVACVCGRCVAFTVHLLPVYINSKNTINFGCYLSGKLTDITSDSVIQLSGLVIWHEVHFSNISFLFKLNRILLIGLGWFNYQSFLHLSYYVRNIFKIYKYCLWYFPVLINHFETGIIIGIRHAF